MAAPKSHAVRIPACKLSVGLYLLTRKDDKKSKSRTIFAANLTELNMSGTSGLSNALVDAAVAASIALLRAERLLILTYVKLCQRISRGTKLLAKNCEHPRKMAVMARPSMDCVTMMVCANPRRCARVRELESPMVDHEARGRLSLRTSMIVFMYVKTLFQEQTLSAAQSVKESTSAILYKWMQSRESVQNLGYPAYSVTTTMLGSSLAIHSFAGVLYRAGNAKAARLKDRAPKYLSRSQKESLC